MQNHFFDISPNDTALHNVQKLTGDLFFGCHFCFFLHRYRRRWLSLAKVLHRGFKSNGVLWRLVRNNQAVSAAARSDVAQLRQVNGFFNQVPYFNDGPHWGIADYWATPVEMLGSFGGDCEDYSVAKYLSLKEIGIPVDLWMTGSSARKGGASNVRLWRDLLEKLAKEQRL